MFEQDIQVMMTNTEMVMFLPLNEEAWIAGETVSLGDMS